MDIGTFFDPATGKFFWKIANGDLVGDDSLQTAIIISLFSDRQADPNDVLPDDAVDLNGNIVQAGSGDRRGWYGDWLTPAARNVPVGQPLPTPTFLTGSRLWLLRREKQLPAVLRKAELYGTEALQWLVNQKIVQSFTVTAEIVRQGVLGLVVDLVRPNGQPSSFRFQFAVGAT
ncbi:MAG TPA: phage GP46 family protein [Aliidongia sp.]|nr:phage GP46 family protein [Aliidongia sp.]